MIPVTVYFLVEGSTEEIFVKNVLIPYFEQRGCLYDIHVVKLGSGRRQHKGGFTNFREFERNLRNLFRQDSINVYYTSMVDLYKFPTSDSPYTPEIQNISDPEKRVQSLEQALEACFDQPHFIPYVQLHEFEALILADPNSLLKVIPRSGSAVNQLSKNIAGLKPEEINEGEQTAPSRRIIQYLPKYKTNKPIYGVDAVKHIGVERLKTVCPHFGQWIQKLEALSG